ncbi:MAG: phage major capsid protein, P2 family [Allosphingosinicella sp.]|uniref:phage major capsid protein, P2 family n=1 Tax=Allosphingosinicella sp. TaxID=2823234 RepID=UPI0039236D60
MHEDTVLAFTNYVEQTAKLNGVTPGAVTSRKFTVAPAVEQKLEERMKESSEFLSRINIIPVLAQEGDKVGISVNRPLAGRTNTAAGTRRTPTDPTSTGDLGRYRCEQTNFDHALRYAKLDAWRHRPEFPNLISSAILKQQGRDRIMIGWNGVEVAAQTNLEANPLLQDVNKGWLFKIRTFAPERVLDDGALTGDPEAEGHVKAIYVADGVEIYNPAANDGAGNADTARADYVNLDALAVDAINLLDEWHRDDTDLVVIVGRDLVDDKYFPIINKAANTPTEVEARDRILASAKQIGGKPAVRVPFFPANAMLITSLDNLSIYAQEGTRRRMVKDEPELDQVSNYESVNESYVVEEYGRCALVENIRMAPKPAAPEPEA